MVYIDSYAIIDDYNIAMNLSKKTPVKGLIFYLRKYWPETGPLRKAFEKFLKNNRSMTVLKAICDAGMDNLVTKTNLVSTYLYSEGYIKHNYY